MKKKQTSISLASRSGLILLVTIFLSELTIMTLFPSLMVSPFYGALLDAGILTFIVNFVVYLWVVLPLNRIENKALLYRQQLEDAEHIAHFGSWEHDLRSDRLTCSKGGLDLFGLDPDHSNLIFKEFLAMVRPEDRSIFRNTLRITHEENHDFELEHQIYGKNGATRFLQIRGRYFFDRSDNPIRTVGTIQDVTEIRCPQKHKVMDVG